MFSLNFIYDFLEISNKYYGENLKMLSKMHFIFSFPMNCALILLNSFICQFSKLYVISGEIPNKD